MRHDENSAWTLVAGNVHNFDNSYRQKFETDAWALLPVTPTISIITVKRNDTIKNEYFYDMARAARQKQKISMK